jgi:hypothetical protein
MEERILRVHNVKYVLKATLIVTLLLITTVMTGCIQSSSPGERDNISESQSAKDTLNIQLVSNQMNELYKLGGIEALNMNKTAIRDYIINSNDGHVWALRVRSIR